MKSMRIIPDKFKVVSKATVSHGQHCQGCDVGHYLQLFWLNNQVKYADDDKEYHELCHNRVNFVEGMNSI